MQAALRGPRPAARGDRARVLRRLHAGGSRRPAGRTSALSRAGCSPASTGSGSCSRSPKENDGAGRNPRATAAYALHALDREEEARVRGAPAAACAAARISSPCRRRPASSLTRRRRWSHRPACATDHRARPRERPPSNVVTLPRRRLTPILGVPPLSPPRSPRGSASGPPRCGTRSTRSARPSRCWRIRPRSRSRSRAPLTPGRFLLAEGALVIRGLEPAPESQTYEAWVIVGETLRAADLSGEDARDVHLLDSVHPRGAIVAVTIERAGGVESPEGRPLHHRASRGREVAALQLSVCGSDARTTAGRHPAGAASASSASSRS